MGTKCYFLDGDTLKSLLILPGVNLRYNLFQLSLSLTLREVAHVIILRSHPANKKINKTFSPSRPYLLDEPLRLDVSASSDVVLGGQHELVVENPLRLVI